MLPIEVGLESACHEVETALIGGEIEAVEGERLGRITTSWTAFAERVRPMLGLDDDRIEMTRADYVRPPRFAA